MVDERTLHIGPWTFDPGLDLGHCTLDLAPWTSDVGLWTELANRRHDRFQLTSAIASAPTSITSDADAISLWTIWRRASKVIFPVSQ